jgi:hypothetical protein
MLGAFLRWLDDQLAAQPGPLAAPTLASRGFTIGEREDLWRWLEEVLERHRASAGRQGDPPPAGDRRELAADPVWSVQREQLKRLTESQTDRTSPLQPHVPACRISTAEPSVAAYGVG